MVIVMFVEVLNKIFNELRRIKNSSSLNRFIKHNKKIFPHNKLKEQGKPIVLFELNSMHSAHIAYSYMSNILALDNKFQIKAYTKYAHNNWLQKILFNFRKFTGQNEFGVYSSFGVNEFIEINLSRAQKNKAKNMFLDVVSHLKNKRDIEELTINNVWVGDLIYDKFLMTYKKPTINLESAEFNRSLLESIEFIIFWEDYLNKNDVRAINISHCSYNMGIPMRIAVHRNIPVYQSNATHIYRLSSNNLFAYNDYLDFREQFSSLPAEVKNAGVAEAQRRINRRFEGEVGVDMSYSTKSAWGAKHNVKLLKSSDRKKILIATHCFFDSPHSYGNNLFPDFYEWLDFLGKITEETNYDWYIKTHPDYLDGTMEIINSFIEKYPKINLLPANTSHHQIIAEGISAVLTVYGTIGFEYAALGIPVINCSQCNPHIAYDFNIHPKNVEDYRRILINLDQLEFTIDMQEVYEYYFMRYIYNTLNLFFYNFEKTTEELGGEMEQFTPSIYDKWLDEWSPEHHHSIISALQLYIQSNDFRMDYSHFGRQFTVDLIERKIS